MVCYMFLMCFRIVNNNHNSWYYSGVNWSSMHNSLSISSFSLIHRHRYGFLLFNITA